MSVGRGKPRVVVTRFAYELQVGPIPDGLFVCHTCDFPRCCNPAHLFLGTNAENMADMVAKGRAARTPITPELRAKMTAGLTGLPKSESHKAALSAAWKPPPKALCPHCGKTIGVNNLSRHIAARHSDSSHGS